MEQDIRAGDVKGQQQPKEKRMNIYDEYEGLSNNEKRRIKSYEAYLKLQAMSGNKVRRMAFEGRLGLRGRVLSGAARLAQQGKLGR